MSESIEVRALLNIAGMRRGQTKRLPRDLALELLDGGHVVLVGAEPRDSAPAAEPDLPETEEVVVVDDEIDESFTEVIEGEGFDVGEGIEVALGEEGVLHGDPSEGDEDGDDSDNGEDIDSAAEAALAAARAEDPDSTWRG